MYKPDKTSMVQTVKIPYITGTFTQKSVVQLSVTALYWPQKVIPQFIERKTDMAKSTTHAHAVMDAIELGYTFELPAHPSFADKLLSGSIGCDQSTVTLDAPHRPVRLYRIANKTTSVNVFEFLDGSQLFMSEDLKVYAAGEVGSLDHIGKAEAALQESKDELHEFNMAVTRGDHKACNVIKERYQMIGGSNADTFTEIKWRINKREDDLRHAKDKTSTKSIEELAQALFIVARKVRSQYTDVQLSNNKGLRRTITQKTLAVCKQRDPYVTNEQWKQAAAYLNNQQRVNNE